MKFYTQWDPPPKKGEVNSGEVVVETAGYVSAQKLIEGMFQAGIRLQQSRGYEFGSDQEVPDDYIDPTRSPGFDLADASALRHVVRRNLQAAADEANRQKEVDDAAALAQEDDEVIEVPRKVSPAKKTADEKKDQV